MSTLAAHLQTYFTSFARGERHVPPCTGDRSESRQVLRGRAGTVRSIEEDRMAGSTWREGVLSRER